MSEKNNVISPELWAPLEQEEKNAEKMERPSLTFLQDGWRRLKSNKIAILSLIVIALITIGAIFITESGISEYSGCNESISA